MTSRVSTREEQAVRRVRGLARRTSVTCGIYQASSCVSCLSRLLFVHAASCN